MLAADLSNDPQIPGSDSFIFQTGYRPRPLPKWGDFERLDPLTPEQAAQARAWIAQFPSGRGGIGTSVRRGAHHLIDQMTEKGSRLQPTGREIGDVTRTGEGNGRRILRILDKIGFLHRYREHIFYVSEFTFDDEDEGLRCISAVRQLAIFDHCEESPQVSMHDVTTKDLVPLSRHIVPSDLREHAQEEVTVDPYDLPIDYPGFEPSEPRREMNFEDVDMHVHAVVEEANPEEVTFEEMKLKVNDPVFYMQQWCLGDAPAPRPVHDEEILRAIDSNIREGYIELTERGTYIVHEDPAEAERIYTFELNPAIFQQEPSPSILTAADQARLDAAEAKRARKRERNKKI